VKVFAKGMHVLGQEEHYLHCLHPLPQSEGWKCHLGRGFPLHPLPATHSAPLVADAGPACQAKRIKHQTLHHQIKQEAHVMWQPVGDESCTEVDGLQVANLVVVRMVAWCLAA